MFMVLQAGCQADPAVSRWFSPGSEHCGRLLEPVSSPRGSLISELPVHLHLSNVDRLAKSINCRVG